MDDTEIKLTDTDTSGTDPELEIDPTPRERKPRGRHKRTLIPVAKRTMLAKNNPYLGMTHFNCADACTRDCCVVSGRPYCAHPHKGGLQRVDLQNLAAINRLNDAKVFVGKQKMT